MEEPDRLSNGDTVTAALPRVKRQKQIQRLFGGVALVLVAAVGVGFVVYIVNADGAARVSALFAGGLVLVSVWLLLWSYIRRPPPGQNDDFLDKFLAGTGQAILLGAVLSFGFGIVGQRLEQEQKARDDQLAADEKARDDQLAADQKERDDQRAAEQAALALRRDLAGQVRADAGGKSFSGVDLREEWFAGLNMSDFDLSEADMSDTTLIGVNLTRAFLAGTDFSDAVMTGVNLTDADLTLADLTGAFLDFADLSRAYLFGADLTGADLTGTDLTNADLTNADLTGTDLTGTDLINADLTDADLSGADLTAANLTGARLTGTRYAADTVWPDGYEPPPTAQLVED